MTGARGRRWIAVAVVVLGTWFAGPPSAAATPADDAAAALATASIYLAPGVRGVRVDTGLAATLPRDLKIAVLPTAAGLPIRLAETLAERLGAAAAHPLTVGVLGVDASGQVSFRATSSKYCEDAVDTLAQSSAATGAVQLRDGDLSSTIRDFAQRLAGAPRAHGDCAAPATPGARAGGLGAAWAWVAAIAALGAGGLGGLVLYRRRRAQQGVALARTRIAPYFDRLASDLTNLDPTSTVAAQALSDARDRFVSAGALMAGAATVDQYELARGTVLEGLYAARAAREALGMDPGPALPSLGSPEHEQLRTPTWVLLRAEQHQGYPSYTPGAPHYYDGGGGFPGGWYRTPFWDAEPMDGVLGGAVFGASDAGWSDGGAEVGAGGGGDPGVRS